MKVLSVQPKDLYVTFEMSLKETLMIQTALGLAKIDFDGTNKEHSEAVHFLTEGFCPVINKLITDLRETYDT